MSDPEVSNLLTVAQAIAVIDAVPVTPRTVRLPLQECRGLCLAQDVAADRDYPPFDKSLMDGYAVRAADVANAPATLRLVGEIAAGHVSARPLNPGECIAIMTGAPIPDGADGVVPIEETSRVDQTVTIHKSADPARFIARRGADTRGGDVILRKGLRLESAQLAAAAAVGAHELTVHPRPRVAVLATGDELVPIDAAPMGSQIRNSNSPMLVALLHRLGCDVTDLGVARDDPQTIRAAIDRGLTFDALFVTGGMSMGAYDFVPRILADAGFDPRVTKLRIKPGKPFVFAVRENCVAFGLPGNPVSGFVCTVRLASRLIARLCGGGVVERWLPARLATALPPNGPREFYQPARIDWTPEGPVATPLKWKGSADLFTLANADALLVRAENEPPLSAGATVRVLEI
jgi:molybdopterin molybdotransferase